VMTDSPATTGLTDPVVYQLSDLGVADLQLCLDGFDLPWLALGGRLTDTLDPATSEFATERGTGQAVVVVDSATAAAAVAAGTIALVDRELTPLARLSAVTEIKQSEPTNNRVLLVGDLIAERRREARLFAELARPPGDLPAAESTTFVLMARPPLVGELAQLAGLGTGPLTLLVPVENATPDGLPPQVLLRSVQAAVATNSTDSVMTVIAVPLAWRDPASDTALSQTVLGGYRGPSGQSATVTTDDPTWRQACEQLRTGSELPATVPTEVAAVLRRWRPPRNRRGLVLLFTGFSGSGKSTVARDVAQFLDAESDRTVSLLDGDDVRRLLSAGLGFDRAARILNVRRIGFVASEIARHGGIAICAPIAPYAQTRAEVRAMVEPVGDFVLVHISTPLAECERRDLKGLYAQARAGTITEFTGISDPYDIPDDADLTLDTTTTSRAQALGRVLNHLRDGGWLTSGGPHGD
jgi:sulfate adenylyltransferase